MKSGIYKIENIKTKKKYIGKSIDVERRIYEHKMSFKNNTCNYKLKYDLNKYGVDSFIFSVIKNVSIDKLERMEFKFIKKYNSIDTGYNIAKVSDISIIDSIDCDEIINKIINRIKLLNFNENIVYISFDDFSKKNNINNEQIKLIIRKGIDIFNKNDIDIKYEFFENRFRLIVSIKKERDERLEMLKKIFK